MLRDLFKAHQLVQKEVLEQVLLRVVVGASENGGIPAIVLLVSIAALYWVLMFANGMFGGLAARSG